MPLRHFRRQHEQLSQFQRGRIIGMMEAGWSAKRVARQLGLSDYFMRRCWDQWIREMSFTRRPGSGRPRQTSRREDLHIVRNARVQPTASLDAIQAQVSSSFGTLVSSRTIQKRLAEGHLESRRLLRVLPLTPTHRLLLLDSDDNRVRVWRPRGELFNPTFALQRHSTPTAGVISQQDNARPHMARVSQDCLHMVTNLPWPARSPDLSAIEHIWDHLGWRDAHPACLNEIEARLQQIRNEMYQDIIQNLYASMPDRIASCIPARGVSTGY
ncbi:transposable element Tcb2 transposase [Trichonephila clavipes]|nr:transposable element Tcb2 transposase [Trichonephila clavipes]